MHKDTHTEKKRQILKKKLRRLFYGTGYESVMFNNLLLLANIFLIVLIIISLFYPESTVITDMEIAFGIVFLMEYLVRLWVADRKISFVVSWLSALDVVVILSLFSSIFITNLGFLHILRALQILRLYRISRSLQKHKKSRYIVRNKEIIAGILNLFVFLFFMTSLMYVSQADVNPGINNYLDAMYFTVTTLTTTGFGDITPYGWTGKLLAILIMVFGITLFVRLGRSMFRKPKIDYTCRDCGLNKHDLDAIHCKHCGRLIKNKVYDDLD